MSSSQATTMNAFVDGRAKRPRAHRAAPVKLFARFAGWLAYVAIFLPLWFIWQIRDEGHLTAESGLGYALGIVGVTAMLLLLTYPMRKRFRFLQRLGSVRHWFRVHMYLGVLGPVLILAHSNFRLGSLNSMVALFSMLTVAISGIAGRYFYSRIHFGLYGARATLKDLQAALEDDSGRLGEVLVLVPDLQKELLGFAARSLTPAGSLGSATGRIVSIGLRTRRARLTTTRTVTRAIKQEAARAGWSSAQRRRVTKEAKHLIANFLGTVRRTVQLSFYERLFALWHVLHIPLFYMLLIAATVHVFAVHIY